MTSPEYEIYEEDLVEEEEEMLPEEEARELARKYKTLLSDEAVSKVYTLLYRLEHELYEKGLEFDLSEYVEDWSGWFSKSARLSVGLERGEPVKIADWDYVEDYDEWEICTFEITPLYRRVTALEDLRDRPEMCSRCMSQDCARCPLAGRKIVAFVIYKYRSGKTWHVGAGYSYASESVAWVVAKEPVEIKHTIYSMASSDDTIEEIERLSQELPAEHKVEVEPQLDLFERVLELYEAAHKVKDKLEKIAEIINKLGPRELHYYLYEIKEAEQ